MTKGQLSARAGERQARVENVQALLGRIKILTKHDSLRVKQAIENRGNLEELLTPVLEDQRVIAADLLRVQEILREIWDEGQETRWEDGV